MATLANMALNDGTATPVARIFIPGSNNSDGTFYFYEPSAGPKVAARTIKVKLTRGKDNGSRYKVDIHIVVPLVDAPASAGGVYTPVPKIVDTSESRHLFWMSNRATQQDRDDLLAFATNCLSNVQIKDIVSKAIAITG